MTFEMENPGEGSGLTRVELQSAATLRKFAPRQNSICRSNGKTSTVDGCHFDEKQADSNARRVLAQLAAFTPAKAPECAPLPSQKRCHELFEYCEETGFLTGRVSRGGRRAGDICGTDSHGYIQLCIDGKLYRAHRVIFKMLTGREPVGYLDHRDGNKINNRLENLREVLPWQNALNRIAPSTSNTGYLGVSWDNKQQKYVASLGVGGKVVKLGSFSEVCCAIVARKHAFNLVIGSPSNDNGRANK